MSEVVRVEVEDHIATIHLDRPPMNPLDLAMQDAIGAAARQVAADADVAAVVFSGGPAVFAAGADVKEMAAMSHAEMVARAPFTQDCMKAVAHIPQPTVAAITGYALGLGLELALCCDFRIAADDAKLGLPEILLGVLPGAGGTQRLPRLIGQARAKDLIFTGRMVDAGEALDIGLVNEVVEPAEVYSTAVARMRRYAGGPALALRAAKEAIDRGLEVDLDTGLALESAHFAGVFATEDRQIGMTSFVEHGPGKARFTGR